LLNVLKLINICNESECAKLSFSISLLQEEFKLFDKVMIKSLKETIKHYNSLYKTICKEKGNGSKTLPIPGKKVEPGKKYDGKKKSENKKEPAKTKAPAGSNKSSSSPSAPTSDKSQATKKAPATSDAPTTNRSPAINVALVGPVNNGPVINGPVSNDSINNGPINNGPVNDTTSQTNNGSVNGNTNSVSNNIPANNTATAPIINNNLINSASNKLSYPLITVIVLVAYNLLL